MKLDGKVVVITGGSEGIGAACAAAFRGRGARLSLTARSGERLAQVGGADALTTAGDITLQETRDRVVERTIERFGRIDVLVNNAGMGMYWPSWNPRLEEARQMFELNFFAPLGMIQNVVPHMRRQKSGTIVNVGSIAGKLTVPWLTLYSSTKWAMGSLTNGLRMELKHDGIHAIQVCPGYVNTDFQRHALGTHPPEKVVGGKKFAISAEECAAAIVRGVERDARTVLVPRMGWTVVALSRLFPAIVDSYLAALHGKVSPEDAGYPGLRELK
ncbi:MAG: SDR family NAD(P)-dependent oxidoreductase [Acidobacteriota bacterium]|nr:SDR family NAD(P)-dependent oxidoreductase [Acidobacteriota bacterium]